MTLIVRDVARRRTTLKATFHGVYVDDLWQGGKQNLSIKPAVVAALIRAHPDGASLDHAERLYPDAVIPFDVADAVLAAACAQWFIPYPGRAALAAALHDTARDFAAVARRFSTPARALTSEQVTRWTELLGI